LTWIVRKECWLPKPFGDPKKSAHLENRLGFLTGRPCLRF